MRVHFRTYCYTCRRNARWALPREIRNPWRHRCVYTWAYYIECDGRRLLSRCSFQTFDRAWASAERSWAKLTAVSCMTRERP